MLDELLAIGVFTSAGFLLVWYMGYRTSTMAPALVAFTVRWAVAIVAYSFMGLAAPDAVYYDATAMDFAEGDFGTAVTAGKEGWPVLLSSLYAVFGHVPQLGLVVNAVAGALTVSAVGIASRLLGAHGRSAAWICALLPSAVLWSSLLLRESIAWFALALCGVSFVGLVSTRKIGRYAALLVVGLAVLFLFRGTAAVVVGAAGLTGVAYAKKKLLKSALLALLATPLFLVSPLGSRLDDVVGGFSADGINNSREALSAAATTGWPYVEVVDAASAIQAWLVAAPRVLVGPFPWEFGTVGVVFLVDGAIWLAIFLLAMRGWYLSPNRRVAAILVFPAAALLLALIATSGNYGTSQRLRVQSEVLLLPIAAAGFARNPKSMADQHVSRGQDE